MSSLQLLSNCIKLNTHLITDVIDIIISYINVTITTYVDSNTYAAYKCLGDNYYTKRYILYKNLKPVINVGTFAIAYINYSPVLIYTHMDTVYIVTMDNQLLNSIKLYTVFISMLIDNNNLILHGNDTHVYIYTINTNYTLTLISIIDTMENVLIAKKSQILVKFHRVISSINYNGIITQIALTDTPGIFEWNGIDCTITNNRLTASY